MFLPENIDFANSEKYVMTIRLAGDGFAFTVHCPTDKNIFCYRETKFSNKLSYLENIQKIIFDYNFFTQIFKKTVVIQVIDRYTIIPDEYYEKKRVEQIYYFNTLQKEEKLIILDNAIKDIKSHILFEMSEDLHDFLMRNLLNPIFEIHVADMIPFLSHYSKEETSKCCFVHFHNPLIDIFTYSDGKLLTANTVRNENIHDAMYLIASSWEKMEFDQLKDKLFITGELSEHQTTIETLRRLIKNIEILNINYYPIIPADDLEKIPADILLKLCE